MADTNLATPAGLPRRVQRARRRRGHVVLHRGLHPRHATRTRPGRPPAGRHEQVRSGIQSRFDGIPDIHYGDDRHFVCGDRGVSEWTIRGTQATGERIEVRGCDLLEFTDGKISRKDSFWKIVD